MTNRMMVKIFDGEELKYRSKVEEAVNEFIKDKTVYKIEYSCVESSVNKYDVIYHNVLVMYYCKENK